MSESVAPEEVVTRALLREVDLSLFGFNGKLSLISLDNGMDHNRPNTLGQKSLQELDAALTSAESSDSVAIAIAGKPFIFGLKYLDGYIVKRSQRQE